MSKPPMVASHALRVVTVAVMACSPFSITVTRAADQCLNRQEARALWPHKYLHWHRQGAQRCWVARHVGHRSARQAARGGAIQGAPPRPLPPSPAPAPPPAVLMPAGLMPPYHVPPVEGPRWQWILDAHAAASEQDAPEPEPVFSSFGNRVPPDIWPVIQREPDAASGGGIAVVLASGLAGVLFGSMLMRRLSRRRRFH